MNEQNETKTTLNSAQNLYLLSQTFKSVSDMCRKVGINRQQMNKYLNRNTHPSAHTARRITAAVGLGPEALFAEPQEFARLLEERGAGIRQRHIRGSMAPDVISDAGPFPEEFLGDYWFYSRVPMLSGVVVRAFIRLERVGPGVRTRFFERLRPGFPPLRPGIFRNRGTAVWRADKIFINENPVSRPSGPSLAVLLPDYGSSLTTLHGLQLYNLTSGSRLPYASRITLRRVDPDLTLLEAARRCGVFWADDPRLEMDICATTENGLPGTETVLLPHLG